jgi:C-terminal processing protease CtpA/Prc
MLALESALDKIFAGTMLKALIIYVRLSFGGDDKLGLAIASRLTEKEYLSSTLQVRGDPADSGQWIAVSQIFVRPSSRPGFRGPVVELFGPITMSAAEDFSQALMGRAPHITTIGENTQGLLGDYLTRRLPNGRTFSVSNAVSRTPDGGMFEVLGIPPDIQKPVFADDDVAAGMDPGLAMAMHILADKK